jgi:hypothetical protein
MHHNARLCRITVFILTPLIFLYHLPLSGMSNTNSDEKRPLASFGAALKGDAPPI